MLNEERRTTKENEQCFWVRVVYGFCIKYMKMYGFFGWLDLQYLSIKYVYLYEGVQYRTHHSEWKKLPFFVTLEI